MLIITAAISSFLTERLLEDDDKDIGKNLEKSIDEKFETLNGKIENLNEENKLLREEIRELKELIEK